MDRLVAEYEQSGMSRKAFCERHGLSVGTLDNYRNRRGNSVPTAAGRILPVEFTSGMPPASSPATEDRGWLWVGLANGRRIEIGSGFDATTLERLMTVLERV